MPYTQRPAAAGGDKTQAFGAVAADATMPHISSNPGAGLATVTIVRGPQTGEVFVIDVPEVTIGRDPSCGLFLNDRTVSRRHAHLSVRDGQAVIEDLGSLNGTWVDGAIVERARLVSGSSIQIGTFKMTIALP
jgi:pSer/pThr/pTyr-binding forkhead associated (FHA) protein